MNNSKATCAFPGCYKRVESMVKNCCDDCNGLFCEEHKESYPGVCSICKEYKNGLTLLKQHKVIDIFWMDTNELTCCLNTIGSAGWELVDMRTELDVNKGNRSHAVFMRSVKTNAVLP